MGVAALAACSGAPETNDEAAEGDAVEIDLSAISVSDSDCPMINQMRAWPPNQLELAPGVDPDNLTDPIANRITLQADDQYGWNEGPIAFETLRQYLEITATMVPPPMLVVGLGPDDNCERVRQLVNMIEETVDCRGGTCELEYAGDSESGDTP